MRSQNMLNTSSSGLSKENRAAVRDMVRQRLGHQWCLFLDRDGVINRRIVGDYVRSPDEFEFLPGAIQALKALRDWAPRLVVVTNQQGIGKGLMSESDVARIHEHIQGSLTRGKGVDEFLVCPHLESTQCTCRKPQPRLVLDWLTNHPEFEPSLSVMAGDSISDMELAGNVAASVGGCASIRIGGSQRGGGADAEFECLWDFAVAVNEARKALI